MGFWSGTRKFGSAVFNFRVGDWIGYGLLKNTFKKIINLIKTIFKPQKSQVTETFEEAVNRLNLTEEDLKQRKKEFRNLILFYLVFSLCLFVYALYLALSKHLWFGSMFTFFLVIITLIHAYKYHFWIFQINNRKLGCSFKDWLNSKSTGKT